MQVVLPDITRLELRAVTQNVSKSYKRPYYSRPMSLHIFLSLYESPHGTPLDSNFHSEVSPMITESQHHSHEQSTRSQLTSDPYYQVTKYLYIKHK